MVESSQNGYKILGEREKLLITMSTQLFTKFYKILDWSKLKAYADDKINVTEKLKLFLEGLKTLWGKEKMLVTSILYFSHNVFKWLILQGR